MDRNASHSQSNVGKSRSGDLAAVEEDASRSGRGQADNAAGQAGASHSDSPGRAQWLISVRNLNEAKLAAKYPIGVLDLKEPKDGPLAAVRQEVWQQVADWMQRPRFTERSDPFPNRPIDLSAALGESDQALSCARSVPGVFRFAKVGPSECQKRGDLVNLWKQVRRRLPHSVELVAVAYADHQAAQTLSPDDVFALAADCGFGRVLIDTFDKSGGGLGDHLGPEELESLIQFSKRRRMWIAVAGSVRLGWVRQWFRASQQSGAKGAPGQRMSFPHVLPDCFGVRGDVCRGPRSEETKISATADREGTLCSDRLAQWRDVMARPNAPSSVATA